MSANYDNNTLHMNYGDENQKNQKPKKGNKAIIVVVLVLVLVALIAAAVVFFVLPKLNNGNPNNNEIVDTNTNETGSNNITAKKLNNDLFYVYDSPYLPQNPAEGYFIGNDYYDVNKIVVPYINIESTSATDANNKIHAFYDEAVTKYNENASTKNTFIKVDYKYYMNKNVISIVVEKTEGGNSVSQNTYLTFNYDLVNNKILDYVEVYKLAGFNDIAIDLTTKYEIENSSFYKVYGSLFNEESLAISKDETNKDYANRKIANELNYYIDSKGNLVIDTNYVIPNNGALRRLLTINKSNEQQPPAPENPNANNVETNSIENNVADANNVVENNVEQNGVTEPTGIVDGNGNLNLSSYEGIFACYFARTTTIKTEIKIYKEEDKWYMDFANRNSYSADFSSRVTTLRKVELANNNGTVTFASPDTTFVGTITFSETEINIKVDQAALNTNITPSTITLNVKANSETLLATE